MDPLEFPSDEVIQDFTLRKLRFMAQQRIPGPDLREMLRFDVERGGGFLEHRLDDMVLKVVGTVYAEDLPPTKVEQSTKVRCEGVAEARFSVPDGPWMRWRARHQTSRWYRILLGWLPPVRHIYHTERVPWSQTKEVTCQVDLSRYYTYPESRIGAHPGLGSVRVAKHTVNAFWSDREIP
jgi:hypothetical protein